MTKVKIIAEIGPNHNGKIHLAKKLIKEAKKCGADYVKFQTFITEDIIIQKAKKAKYQIDLKKKYENQFSMLKKLEFSYEDFRKIHKYCKNEGIKFLSTAFDIKSLKFVNSLKPDYIKIPSGEITNLQLIEEVVKLRKKIIISTGMSNLEEIKKALKIILKKKFKKKNITILQCNTEYPTPVKDVNLNVLKTFKEKFKLQVGYSDHTMGIDVPIAATAMGAKIIEKHFTLDRKMKGPDHKASLEPNEFKDMVNSIRRIEKAMGSRIKKITSSEKKNLKVARKSIVASKNINKGEKFTKYNLSIKRPGSGLSPMKWYEVLGKVAKKKYLKDDLI